MTAPPGPPPQPRALRVLLTGNVLQAMGLQVFVPILPIYLKGRGSSSALVGITIAAGIAGYGLAQFPSGWVADRFDRRRVLIAGMGAYAALFLVYLFPIQVELLPIIRLLHAGVGGLYSVASVAMLGDLTPPARRGRMFGLWQATSRSGFLIGPLLGGAIASVRLSAAFIGSALVYGVATVVMTRLPRDPPRVTQPRSESPQQHGLSLARAVLPLVAIAAAGDYAAGAFNSIWSFWLGSKGATPWQIGLSFCLFALPSVALSAGLGAVTDRRGPQRMVLASLVGLICVAPMCALAASVLTLTLVAMLIGLVCTPNRPVVFAAATHEFSGEYLGRAQGALQGGLMSVQFVAALTSGALLSVSPALAFGALSVVAAGSLVAAIRHPSAVPAGPERGR